MSVSKYLKSTCLLSSLASTIGGLTYSTGTITQSGIIITGSGTTFTEFMVGGLIFVPGIAQPSLILGYVSATGLIVDLSTTISSATSYILYYNGLESSATGVTSKNFNLVQTSSIFGTSSNSTYSTGTATVSANVVTGSGTTFTSAMVGGIIRFTSGQSSMITVFTSVTSLTLSDLQCNGASGTFVIFYGRVQIGGLGVITANTIYLNTVGSLTKIMGTATSNQTLQLPNITSTDVVAVLSLAQTLSNKTLVAPILQSTTTFNSAVTKTFWGTTGVQIAAAAATYTDSSSSGTQSTMNAVNAIGFPTLAASSTTTYTSAATLYIAGAPLSGGNVTITNAYGLYVNNGLNYLGGATTITSTLTLSSYTTNCIAFINGSNQLSTSTNLGYDGTKVSLSSSSTSENLFTITGTGVTSFALLAITGQTASSSKTTGLIEQIQITGDTTNRLNIYTDGIGLGAGGSSAQDSYVYRSAASLLQIDGDKLYGSSTTTTNLYLNGLLGVGIRVPTAKVQLSGNITEAFWGITGIGFSNLATTYTDSTSSGTQTTLTAINALATPTLAASNATIYTNASTLYIDDEPAEGTNVTITNPYALYINSGNSYFGDLVISSKSSAFTGFNSHLPIYASGTLSQSGTTGTGIGTNFQPYMVGAGITFDSGQVAYITGYVSATSITLTPSQNVSNTGYTLFYSNTYSTGTVSQSSTYATGTVTQNTTTVTGSGTTFTSAMNGGIITITGFGSELITAFGSTTSLTVSNNQHITAATAYTILYNQNTLTGVGTTFTPTMVGGMIYFSTSGSISFITGFVSPTVLTVYPAQSIASQNYIIFYATGYSTDYQNISSRVPTLISTGTVGVYSSIYNTGTVTQSGITITGSGTTFTSSMVGGAMTITGFTTVYVMTFISATSLTVSTSQTISSGATYSLYLPGTTVTGSSTAFTVDSIGGNIIYDFPALYTSGFTTSFITSFTSSTSLSVASNIAVPVGTAYVLSTNGVVQDSISGNLACQDLYAYHLISKAASVPLVYFGTGSGQSGTIGAAGVTAVTITGSDTCGTITFTTGAGIVANAPILTVLFTRPYLSVPTVFTQGANTATLAIAANLLVSATTTSFTINDVTTGLGSTTTYSIKWITMN